MCLLLGVCGFGVYSSVSLTWGGGTKDLDHILDTKIPKFQTSHFQYIFNCFGFLVDITPKVMSGSSYSIFECAFYRGPVVLECILVISIFGTVSA